MSSPNGGNPLVQPCDVVIKDRVLTIIVRKEFDFGTLHQQWAKSLIDRFPGPFLQVVVDLSHCGLVSSTFFAGILVLHGHYVTAIHSEPIRLVSPDPRVLRNLKVMKMDRYFHIVPREQMSVRTPLPQMATPSSSHSGNLRVIKPSGL